MLEASEVWTSSQDQEFEPPYARTEFEETILFSSAPDEMTKNEKLYTKFRRNAGCIFGNGKCEESSLDCDGLKLRCFGDEYMSTLVKVSRYGNSNKSHINCIRFDRLVERIIILLFVVHFCKHS